MRGEDRHTCQASDKDRVEAMLDNIPREIRDKLTSALLRRVGKEHPKMYNYNQTRHKTPFQQVGIGFCLLFYYNFTFWDEQGDIDSGAP